MTFMDAHSEGQAVGGFEDEKMTHTDVSPFASGLFPLPRPPPLAMCRGLSRGASQRLSRKVRIHNELRETISALNWMHTGDFDSQPTGLTNPLQQEVLDRVNNMIDLAGDLGDLRHLPSQEAALRELLHGQDGYAEPSVPASLAPFKLELISLPQDLRGAPRAEDLLPMEDRRYLEVQERMLRSDLGSRSESVSKPYWDPALKNNPRNYRRFIQKLHNIEYLEYTLSPSQHAGVFFVWKSDRQKIRMIVDARPANSEFVDPPGVSLSTAETFAKFEVEDGPGGLTDDFGLFVGLSDLKDCFHRIKQPRWLSKHFCFLPIEARHVGMTGCWLEGRRLESSDLIYPMPGSLCMGFTWSLFFAQRINEAMMGQVTALSNSSLIHDRGGPAVFSSASPQEIKHFVYVDNLGVLSPNREAVGVGLDELSQRFTSEKLLLHPGEVLHEQIKALGVELDGKSLTSKISSARFHRVRQGVRCVLSRGRCSGRVLEILIGHCTYCGLMNRSLLSVFHSSYKFIRSNYYVHTKLWTSVVSELRAFSGLMPFLRADWRRPWSKTVTVSDASEEGFGVCASRLPLEAVQSIGRVSERERFRRSSGHSAREAALTSAGFVKDEVTGKWTEGVLEDEDYLLLSGWELDESFPEVSKQYLHEEDWCVVRQGAWKKREHIVYLEARALVKSFEFIVHDHHSSNTRQLFLVDSMSAALAFDRCRSKNHRMLRQIRKFCSLGLARNISFSVRWVPSEFNPADAPSRDLSRVVNSVKTEGSKTGVPHQSRVVNSVKTEGSKTGVPHLHATEADRSAGTADRSRNSKETLSSLGPRNTSEFKELQKKQDIRSTGCSPAVVERAQFQVANAGPVEPGGHFGSQGETTVSRGEQQFGIKFGVSSQEHPLQAAAAKEQEQAEEVRSGDNGVCQCRAFTFGAESHWGEGQPGVSGFDHFLQEPTAFNEDPSRVGHLPESLLQPFVSARASCPPWGQDSCLSNASYAAVWETGNSETAAQLEGFEGLETFGTRKFQKGLPTVSVVSHQLRTSEKGLFTDGLVYHDGVVSLHQTGRTSEMQSLQPGEAESHHHRVLDFAAQSGGEARAFKSGGVRRQRRTRLSLFEALGAHPYEAVGGQRSGASPMELRLFPLLQDLWSGSELYGTGHDSLPAPPQRAINRSQSKSQKLGGSPEAWKMEEPQECGQIREECSVGRKLPSSPSIPATPLPRRRTTVRGCNAQPGSCSYPTFKAKGLKGQYVADFFAGVGGVAKACRKLGYNTKEWEISRGDCFDLTRNSVLRQIRQDIQCLLILGAMLAPPCSSFSIARDRTAVIRTKDHPWGVPACQLSEKDQERIALGNKCFRSAIKIISWLDAYGIPWILENPATSKCWLLPPLQRLAASSHVCTVLTDFCQHGCAWRKRTKLLCGNLDAQDVARLSRLCTGRGVCSKSLKQHFQLTGSNHLGVPWTRVAQPYPAGLCRDLAFTLTSPTHVPPHL